ncbi:hypothetical protein LSAT2_003548 [Lamellibrachia satsuma]|nr:hypothetical protein LSAT2_003548 [Lamellibrachia satsuma]
MLRIGKLLAMAQEPETGIVHIRQRRSPLFVGTLLTHTDPCHLELRNRQNKRQLVCAWPFPTMHLSLFAVMWALFVSLTSSLQARIIKCYECIPQPGTTKEHCADPFRPTTLTDTCYDRTCVKRVTSEEVQRFCIPEEKKSGCEYKTAGTMECYCKKRECNSVGRTGLSASLGWLPFLVATLGALRAS